MNPVIGILLVLYFLILLVFLVWALRFSRAKRNAKLHVDQSKDLSQQQKLNSMKDLPKLFSTHDN